MFLFLNVNNMIDGNHWVRGEGWVPLTQVSTSPRRDFRSKIRCRSESVNTAPVECRAVVSGGDFSHTMTAGAETFWWPCPLEIPKQELKQASNCIHRFSQLPNSPGPMSFQCIYIHLHTSSLNTGSTPVFREPHGTGDLALCGASRAYTEQTHHSTLPALWKYNIKKIKSNKDPKH